MAAPALDLAQPGTQENGIHEVTGSIPVSSTNPDRERL
jgi:hypothetical protein